MLSVDFPFSISTPSINIPTGPGIVSMFLPKFSATFTGYFLSNFWGATNLLYWFARVNLWKVLVSVGTPNSIKSLASIKAGDLNSLILLKPIVLTKYRPAVSPTNGSASGS